MHDKTEKSKQAAHREIRARFTNTTITVYQAYSHEIADAALAAGTFVAPFKRDRMTWIKPSFLWMAYRSGWATKPNQETVLAIKITREGFEWALAHACLSHYEPETYATPEAWRSRKESGPVRVQWDPERDLHLNPLPHRSIQIGLGGNSVPRYVDEWIVSIEDATRAMHQTATLVQAGNLEAARATRPEETPYPLPPDLVATLGATPIAS